jgi:large subunit ribosomal protein L24
MAIKYKIKKDDEVIVVTGKDKKKTGKVVKVDAKSNKLIVENINRVKRHLKPNQKNPDGGIIEKEMPISVSNVMYYCKKCKKGIRVGYKFLSDNKKSRFCKSCGEVLDKD